jgi:predicted phage baseplate assembly protein
LSVDLEMPEQEEVIDEVEEQGEATEKWKDLQIFELRKTAVYAQSEVLELTEERPAVQNAISSNSVVLNRLVDGLKIGQPVSITGALASRPEVKTSEIAIISCIDLASDKRYNLFTKLTFENNLANTYEENTVTINANVTQATHGETRKREEVVGSGDPSERRQEFVLAQYPLTFIPSTTGQGIESTLKVFVNNIEWTEVPFLYSLKPNDNAYITRRDNYGKIHVIFGDGTRGARPQAGIENVKANYRIGLGNDGILKEDQLSILLTRPLGVRSVRNPMPTAGAHDPEDLEHARQNASFNVLTMRRIVTINDFETFAIAFGGIGKAQANWVWDGEKKIVHLTVTSALGQPVDPKSNLHKNLLTAINTYKDPLILFRLDSFNRKLFIAEISLEVAPDIGQEKAIGDINVALLNKFSFGSRQFGQAVTKNEVIVAIQQVKGVVMADIAYLYTAGENKELKEIIPSNIAHWNNVKNEISKGDLLTFKPDSVIVNLVKESHLW